MSNWEMSQEHFSSQIHFNVKTEDVSSTTKKWIARIYPSTAAESCTAAVRSEPQTEPMFFLQDFGFEVGAGRVCLSALRS